MKPYAYQGTGHTVHPHDICKICSGQPRSNKTTRQHTKKEIKQQLKDTNDTTNRPPTSGGTS